MAAAQRKKIGLALGGGVVRGLAHMGVLAVLEEAHIPIDYIAGTSAGSLIGSIFSAGYSVSQIQALARQISWGKVARLVWPVQGFVSFAPLEHWLVKSLGDLCFEDLKIPFAAMATDIHSGKPVKLSTGRVAPAVRASASVAGFVTPIELEGKLLVDGSFSDTVPIRAVREMGADYVIGVDIFTPYIRRWMGPFGYGLAVIEIMVENAGCGVDQADCLIAPQLAGTTYVRFSKRDEFYRLGRQAAEEKLPATLQAINA